MSADSGNNSPKLSLTRRRGGALQVYEQAHGGPAWLELGEHRGHKRCLRRRKQAMLGSPKDRMGKCNRDLLLMRKFNI